MRLVHLRLPKLQQYCFGDGLKVELYRLELQDNFGLVVELSKGSFLLIFQSPEVEHLLAEGKDTQVVGLHMVAFLDRAKEVVHQTVVVFATSMKVAEY